MTAIISWQYSNKNNVLQSVYFQTQSEFFKKCVKFENSTMSEKVTWEGRHTKISPANRFFRPKNGGLHSLDAKNRYSHILCIQETHVRPVTNSFRRYWNENSRSNSRSNCVPTRLDSILIESQRVPTRWDESQRVGTSPNALGPVGTRLRPHFWHNFFFLWSFLTIF